jgi:ribosomal protein S18 acetylase RimI-like enzyme
LGSTIQKKIAGRRKKVTYGYLVWFAVSPHHRRKGIGEGMYNFFIEVMKELDVTAVIVDTTDTNEAASGFFGKVGFELIATHKFLEKRL